MSWKKDKLDSMELLHLPFSVQREPMNLDSFFSLQARECKTGNPENSHRFCNETCKETNLASLDAFSFQKSVFGSDFLEHVDDVSPKSNTSLWAGFVWSVTETYQKALTEQCNLNMLKMLNEAERLVVLVFTSQIVLKDALGSHPSLVKKIEFGI